MGVAVGRSISHGKAYSEYSLKKDKDGRVTATFVCAKNILGITDSILVAEHLDDLWLEMKEAGRDYVRKGKDVKRDVFAIEWSPTQKESEGWTVDDWQKYAEELLSEVDKVQLFKPRRDPKTRHWVRDEKGNVMQFPVPKTDLCHSKWFAFLHFDAASGIPHLHVTVSRYQADGKTLNCDTDFAKKTAQAAEALNEKYRWTKAMDIRAEHINEINNVINTILDEMGGDEIDLAEFECRMKAATFVDYKGRLQHYDFLYHRDDQGRVDGYSVMRGKSKFTADQLGQKIVNIADDRRAEIKDAIYDVLRQMNTPMFDWMKFVELLQKSGRYQVDLKRDTKGNVVRYDIKCGGRTYNASQIGAKITARKIVREWERIRREQEKATQRTAPRPATSTTNTPGKPVFTDAGRKQQNNDQGKPVHIQQPREQSRQEKEARAAVNRTRQILNKFYSYSFNVFDRDEMADLHEGIVGKCLLGGRDTTRENLKETVGELVGMAEGMASQAVKATKLMMQLVIDMALPVTVPSVGGGGGDTGGWRGKRDDEWWDCWMPLFRRFRSRGRRY